MCSTANPSHCRPNDSSGPALPPDLMDDSGELLAPAMLEAPSLRDFADNAFDLIAPAQPLVSEGPPPPPPMAGEPFSLLGGGHSEVPPPGQPDYPSTDAPAAQEAATLQKRKSSMMSPWATAEPVLANRPSVPTVPPRR